MALFVAGLLVSLGSWNVSIWTDESVTISASDRTLAQLWALIQNIDAVHALYYAVMTPWISAFGLSEFWIRLPSALAFAGTVAGVLVLTRRIASPGTALIAAAVCATLPRMTWAGIEARPFVFSALIAVWVTWAYVRAAARPHWTRWVAYGGFAVLSVFVNIYLVLLIVAHGLTTGILHRRRRSVWVGYSAASAAAAIVVLPFLLLVRSQQAQLGTGGDRNPLSILRKILINQLFLGETPSAAALPTVFGRAWQVGAVTAAVIGLSLIVASMLRRSATGDDKRRILALALPWLVLPTVVIAAYAVLVSPIYQPRYFTFTAPAAAIVIALGLRSLRRRWVMIAAAVVYLCAVAVVIASQRTPFAKSGSDWADAASVVAQNARPGDAVYFAPRYDPATTEPITLTSRRIAQSYPGDFTRTDDLTLIASGADTASLDGFSAPLESEQLSDYDTVWMLYGNRFPSLVVDDADAILEEAGFTSAVRWSGPGSTVLEYSRER